MSHTQVPTWLTSHIIMVHLSQYLNLHDLITQVYTFFFSDYICFYKAFFFYSKILIQVTTLHLVIMFSWFPLGCVNFSDFPWFV